MTGSGKQKQPALTETEQLKIATKRSRIQTLNSQASGSGDGVDILPKVPDEQVHEKTGTDEGAANKDSYAHDDDDDDDATESDDDGDNITHPKLSTFSTDDQEEQDDEEEQEEDDEDEEEISDQLGNAHHQIIKQLMKLMNLGSKMKEAVDVAIQLKSNKLREEAQAENQEFLNSLCSNLIASSLSELELKRILMDKMEENKSIDRSDVQKNLYNALVEAYTINNDLLSSYGDRSSKEAESSKEPTRKESRTTSSSKGASRSQPTDLNETTHLEFITSDDDDVIPAREVQDVRQWHPPTSPTPNREWHLTKTVSDLPPQHWITDLAQAAGTQSSFDEFMATPIDFSAFMINRLKIDHLTQELLTGPTYDLIKGTYKSVAELDYHLEEVFKATNEQLD
ncbi:hypothetical protein Tco_0218831 [Tanacetum coccineum]